MKKTFFVIFLFIFCERLDLSCAPKTSPTKEPNWIKLPTKKLGIGSEGYFITVSVSKTSLSDAEAKCKEELGALFYNLTNEYLSRLNPPTKTEFDFLLKDLIEKEIKNVLNKASEYFEVRDKYEDKREKKYYILGGIQSERLLKMLNEELAKIYEKEKLLNFLKENKETYRVRISSDYYEEIKSILEGNNFIVDNQKYFAQIIGAPSYETVSKLASLGGPLWTIKAQYIIYIKDKKGNVIGKISSSQGKGVSNSKEEAQRKALSEISINLNKLNDYIPALKIGIESYLERELTNTLPKIEEKIKVYYADALKYFENKDYQSTLTLLENIHILNKDFPACLILYLRTKGSLEGEVIE
ncbi:MAG: hypothetical protein N2323_03090 [candidate division WOR-3 bacterium]|nr:hypothetical protein [candidate division WOR-3 bacterium]MCX7836928.1 hypothetical protein [candidate division WOR-3 bacterium]MDW8114592.1 hypothetical protein [candidate division WOR-3 bacterium]